MVGGDSCLPEELRPPKELKFLFEVFWNSYFSAEIEFREKHQKTLICSDIIGMLTILLST